MSPLVNCPLQGTLLYFAIQIHTILCLPLLIVTVTPGPKASADVCRRHLRSVPCGELVDDKMEARTFTMIRWMLGFMDDKMDANLFSQGHAKVMQQAKNAFPKSEVRCT